MVEPWSVTRNRIFYLFKSIETFLSRQMFHSTMAIGMWLEAGSQTTLFFKMSILSDEGLICNHPKA